MTALSIAEAERRMAVNPQVSVVGAADSEAGGQLATVTSLPNAEAGKDAARPEIPRAAGVSRQAWVGGVSRDIAIPPRAGVSRAAVAPGAAATGRGATGRMVVPGRAPAVAPGAISRAIAGPPAPGIPAPRRAASARPAAPARSAARAHAAASARLAASPTRPAVSPAPVRLTARGRRVVAGLAAIAAAAAACLLSLALAGGAAAASHGPAREGWPAAQKVVVEPGQTLWSIATAAEPGADTRAVIDQIVAANHLPGDTIEPGQALWVPAR
jgi:hypothetical protein